MKVKIFVIFAIIVFVILAGVVSFLFLGPKEKREQKPIQAPAIIPVSNMRILSSAFTHNGTIPAKYTCDGEDVSPPFTISEVPSGAQSLVLIVDDPDAPGRTFVHWTLWNINPQTTEIPEDKIPEEAIEGLTDFGEKGYGGPCPPSGTHRYFFKLYALDTKLALENYLQKQDIEKEIQGHILAQSELIGLYSREK
jgi:Raf kinase inhibitor-like YbhB/YbcL family protein